VVAAVAAAAAAPRAPYATAAAPGSRQAPGRTSRAWPSIEKHRPHLTHTPADDACLQSSSSCERSLLLSMRSPVDERVTSRLMPPPKKRATEASGLNTFALCGFGSLVLLLLRHLIGLTPRPAV